MLFFVAECSTDQSKEEGMRTVGAALEFRMELHTDVKIIFGNFHRFDDVIIRRGTADDKPGINQTRAEIVIEFITVTVTLGNIGFAIATIHLRTGHYLAGICAETERTALRNIVILIRQEINYLMRRLRIKFAGVRVCHAGDAPCKCDDRNLHSEANPKVGKVVRAAVIRRRDFPLDPAATEPAGDDHAVHIGEHFGNIIGCDRFGIDPLDLNMRAVDITCVPERFGMKVEKCPRCGAKL